MRETHTMLAGMTTHNSAPTSPTRLLTVRIPGGWWEQLEEIAVAEGYMSPSELVREYLRECLTRSRGRRGTWRDARGDKEPPTP